MENRKNRINNAPKGGGKGRKTGNTTLPPSMQLMDPLPLVPTHGNPNQRIIFRVERPEMQLVLRILAASEQREIKSADLQQSRGDSTSIRRKTTGSVEVGALAGAAAGGATSGSATDAVAGGNAVSGKASAMGSHCGNSFLAGSTIPFGYFLGNASSLANIVAGNDRAPADGNHADLKINKRGDQKQRQNLIFPDTLAAASRASDKMQQLNLADFRPLQAPFVPRIIRLLVNSIESYCYANNWNLIYDVGATPDLNQPVASYLRRLTIAWRNEQRLNRVIGEMTPQLQILVLRRFLSYFKIKPLHFSKKALLQILERPLFDQFLRPNPGIRAIVRNIVLPTSRTCLDTLSFLMIHLLHAWEYAANPITAKMRLAEIYGPLIVSFAERPTILDKDIGPTKTEESAILEVIMDVCESHFWNNLSMLKIRAAFERQTAVEQRRNLETRAVTRTDSSAFDTGPGSQFQNETKDTAATEALVSGLKIRISKSDGNVKQLEAPVPKKAQTHTYLPELRRQLKPRSTRELLHEMYLYRRGCFKEMLSPSYPVTPAKPQEPPMPELRLKHSKEDAEETTYAGADSSPTLVSPGAVHQQTVQMFRVQLAHSELAGN